jgi:hypothetical protein
MPLPFLGDFADAVHFAAIVPPSPTIPPPHPIGIL